MKSKTSVAILCSAIAASVFGGTIYVSPAGGGDGSSAESPSTYYEVMRIRAGATLPDLGCYEYTQVGGLYLYIR